MSKRQSNRLFSDPSPLEARVMLAGETDAEDGAPDAAPDARGPRRERDDSRRGRSDSPADQDASTLADSDTATPLPSIDDDGSAPATPATGLASDLGTLAGPPIAPVEGPRDAFFFAEGPSTADISSVSQRARLRANAISDTDSNYIGLVSTGDSIFATVPTTESIALAQTIQDAAEDARDAGLFNDEEEISDDEAVEIIRSFIQGDLTEPLEDIDNAAFTNALTIAIDELEEGETVSPDRLQQIENNATARIAQAIGAASFVNNSISSDNSDEVTLTFNRPNSAIDGGPATTAQADRPPQNFTLQEITSERFSINDFQEGDTITLPANIAFEGTRLQDLSAELNAETTVGFAADGSTFTDASLFESFAEEIADNPEANLVGDGATLSGVFSGVTPFAELAEFTGGTENNVADLHTHPPRAFAFEPLGANGVPVEPDDPENDLTAEATAFVAEAVEALAAESLELVANDFTEPPESEDFIFTDANGVSFDLTNTEDLEFITLQELAEQLGEDPNSFLDEDDLLDEDGEDELLDAEDDEDELLDDDGEDDS